MRDMGPHTHSLTVPPVGISDRPLFRSAQCYTKSNMVKSDGGGGGGGT